MARGAAEAARHGTRLAGAIGTLAFASTSGLAQAEPTLRAAFAAGAHRGPVPALRWLCSTHLPQRAEWPRGLDAEQPFIASFSPRGLRIVATEVHLPPNVAAAGSCSFGDGPLMLWSCASDGTEDWFVPLDFEAPPAHREALCALQADLLDQPRRLAAPVVIGHLAGALSEGEPRADLLRLGAALCGEVTWTAWRTSAHVRVRGRSDGGLLLPAALLLLATAGAEPTTAAMSLRAFGSLDGDRAEAARQLSRTERSPALATLRALLRADDQVRLAAIDALVRLGAVEEMPFIVAAADSSAPWATLAATDAVRKLWIDAPPHVRQRTRAALASSASFALRAIDTATLATRRAPLPAPDGSADAGARARLLAMLGVLATGLYGLWLRERCRSRLATA